MSDCNSIDQGEECHLHVSSNDTRLPSMRKIFSSSLMLKLHIFGARRTKHLEFIIRASKSAHIQHRAADAGLARAFTYNIELRNTDTVTDFPKTTRSILLTRKTKSLICRFKKQKKEVVD